MSIINFSVICFHKLVAKFRFIGLLQKGGHCEPVRTLAWQSPKFSGIFRIFDDKCLKIRGIATASVRTGFAMTALL